MEVRQAVLSELPEILSVYEYARGFMKKTGNPNQWQDRFPEEKEIVKSIENGTLMALSCGGEILGTFDFINGPDQTYDVIENGAWLNDEPYVVLHKVASSGKAHGVLEAILKWCSERADNIRIDTHEDNKIMQYLLEKNGFEKCGIIYVRDHDPRIAYQRIS